MQTQKKFYIAFTYLFQEKEATLFVYDTDYKRNWSALCLTELDSTQSYYHYLFMAGLSHKLWKPSADYETVNGVWKESLIDGLQNGNPSLQIHK